MSCATWPPFFQRVSHQWSYQRRWVILPVETFGAFLVSVLPGMVQIYDGLIFHNTKKDADIKHNIDTCNPKKTQYQVRLSSQLYLTAFRLLFPAFMIRDKGGGFWCFNDDYGVVDDRDMEFRGFDGCAEHPAADYLINS